MHAYHLRFPGICGVSILSPILLKGKFRLRSYITSQDYSTTRKWQNWI